MTAPAPESVSAPSEDGNGTPVAPRVSVVMSVYNDQSHLQEAVESILAQTFEDFELIAIDDGSTDQSSALLKAFDDPRLKILEQDNRGLTCSLIRGVSTARGQYLARQDADDVSDAERLAEQVAFLDSHPEVALVGTMAAIIDERGDRISSRRLEARPDAAHGKLSRENQFVHGSLMMRRDAYQAVGGYREFFRYSQDYDLVLRLAERWQTANLPNMRYRHRMRADEVSIRHNREQERFRDIARELHRERALGKPDRLDAGRMEEIPRAEDSTDGDHVDAYRSRYIHTCLRSGMLGNARREIINRLKQRPTHPKSYLQLLLTYLNRRLVVALFKVWDRMRGAGGV